MPSKKAGGAAAPLLKQTHVTFAESEGESEDEYEEAPAVIAAEVDKGSSAFDEGLDDMAWLRSKQQAKPSADGDSPAAAGGDQPAGREPEPKRAEAGGGDGGGAAGVSEKEQAARLKAAARDAAKAKAAAQPELPPGGKGGKDWGPEAASADVGETARLFVRNLPYVATEEEVEAHFEQWGPLREVHIQRDRGTKQSKGVAYVQYDLGAHAVMAMESADGQIFQGRLLHVLPGAAPKVVAQEEGAGGGGGGGERRGEGEGLYKRRRQEEQRADGEAGYNWNSLFLASNTVADATAQRLGTSKAAVLGKESEGSAAVRLALGETQMLGETRSMLEEEGLAVGGSSAAEGGEEVALDKHGKVKRSSTAILVKNIPFSTTEAELTTLFEEAAGGPLARVALPPAKTLALVECVEPSDAKRAFKRLAYKNFKKLPLFLEWAPLAAAAAAARAVPDKPANDGSDDEAAAERGSESEEEEEEAVGGEVEEGRTLFVKNINFKTASTSLQSVFEKTMGRGSVLSVKLPTRAAKGNGKGKALPTGFGFVEMKDENLARQALRRLQVTALLPFPPLRRCEMVCMMSLADCWCVCRDCSCASWTATSCSCPSPRAQRARRRKSRPRAAAAPRAPPPPSSSCGTFPSRRPRRSCASCLAPLARSSRCACRRSSTDRTAASASSIS